MDNSTDLPESALLAARHSIIPLCKKFPTLAIALGNNAHSEMCMMLYKQMNALTKDHPFYETYLYLQDNSNPPIVHSNFPVFNFQDIVNHPECPIVVCDFYSWMHVKECGKDIYFYVYDPMFLFMTEDKYKQELLIHNTPLIARNKEHRELLKSNGFKNVHNEFCDINNLEKLLKIIGEVK